MTRFRSWQVLACLATSSCWLLAGVEEGRLRQAANDAEAGSAEAGGGDPGNQGDGASAPLVVASKQVSPEGIAADATYLYWTNHVRGGNVMRCRLPDCTGAAPIATEATGAFAIVTDNVGGVFWATPNDIRASLDGGAAFSDAPGPGLEGVTGLAFVGGTWTYLVAALSSSLLEFYNDAQDTNVISGTEDAPHAVVGDQGGGASPGAVFWVSRTGIRRQCVGEPSACDSEATISTLVPGVSARALALDATSVSWVDDVGGTVSSTPRVRVDGGVAQLAGGQNRPWSIAADGTYVYFTNLGTNQGDGQVARVPKTGGKVEVLAERQAQPWAIVVTRDSLYWTNNGDGTVMRLPK